MNTPILKKCIEELQKESFRKDYVLGMLETLVEMQSSIQPIGLAPGSMVEHLAVNKVDVGSTPTVPAQEVDEIARLEAETLARIRNIGPLEA